MQSSEIYAVLALLVGIAAGAFLAHFLTRGGHATARQQAEAQRLEAEKRREELARELGERVRERDAHRNEAEKHKVAAARLDAEIAGHRAQLAPMQEQARAAAVQSESFRQELAEVREMLASAKVQLIADRKAAEEARVAQLEAVEAARAADRAAAEEKLTLLTSAREELSHQFKVLAAEILKENSKTFTEHNQASVNGLLAPLHEKLGEFQKKVEGLQESGIAGRAELKTQIADLKSLNERLSSDATNLVNALRGSSKTQGDWGEFVLEQMLENSGLRKGHEYRVQTGMAGPESRNARPDVVLNLPGNKHLVIDAKVSLVDYSAYCDCDDDVSRAAALARHVGSVRAHIKELSGRNYQSLYELQSMDFVVMFVPIEPAFMLAIARDGSLWQEAWDKNVLLVSPSTLLFVVRTVAHLWRQEQQTRNVQEIVRRGGELYDKLAAFAKDLTDVGRYLGNAQSSYDNAYNKLTRGKGNAMRQIEMLRVLGVKSSKQMPKEMADVMHDERVDELVQELAEETSGVGGADAAEGSKPLFD